MSLPRILLSAAAGATVALAVANHWPRHKTPTVCDPPAWTTRELDCGADVVLEITGANDLVYGLAPIAGQETKRVGRFLASHAWLRGIVGPRLLAVIQPAPTGRTLWETRGIEAEAHVAYAWMAMVGDVDLSGVSVDYVDVVHFGDRGHELVAAAVVRAVRARDAATRREEDR